MRALEQSGAAEPRPGVPARRGGPGERQAAGGPDPAGDRRAGLLRQAHLYQALLAPTCRKTPACAGAGALFPQPLRERFRERIHAHRLRREILASSVANRLINRMGSTFVFRLQEELGVDAAASCAPTRGLGGAWDAAALVGRRGAGRQVPDALQRQMLWSGTRLDRRASRWLLKNGEGPIKVSERIERYRRGSRSWPRSFPSCWTRATRCPGGAASALTRGRACRRPRPLGGGLRRPVPRLRPGGGGRGLRRGCGRGGPGLFRPGRCPTARLAGRSHLRPTQRGPLARRSASRLSRRSVRSSSHALCRGSDRGHAGRLPAARLETWQHLHHGAVDAWLGLLAELEARDEPDLAMLSVALRAVHKLAASAVAKGGGSVTATSGPQT